MFPCTRPKACTYECNVVRSRRVEPQVDREGSDRTWTVNSSSSPRCALHPHTLAIQCAMRGPRIQRTADFVGWNIQQGSC